MEKSKASKNLIRSIIAFVASVVLCIGAVLAWFATNSKVDANGLNSGIRSTNIEKFEISAIALSGKTTAEDGTVSYTVGETKTTAEMAAYGNTDHEETALLLKFTYKFFDLMGKNYGIYAEFAKTLGNVVKLEGNADFSLQCNLSDILNFYDVVTETEISTGTTVARGGEIANEDAGSKVLGLNGGAASDSSTVLTFYCIIDYDDIAIEDKYSYAINNIEGCSLSSRMLFKNDVNFFMQEV